MLTPVSSYSSMTFLPLTSASVAMSRAYVVEQISDQLNAAMDAAKARRNITLVLSPGGVISADQAYNLNQDVVTELNRRIPSAQLVPPATYETYVGRVEQLDDENGVKAKWGLTTAERRSP